VGYPGNVLFGNDIASFDPRLVRFSSTDWSDRQRIRRGGSMSKKRYGDYQFDIYFDGLERATRPNPNTRW
jgi:hypothetical protein